MEELLHELRIGDVRLPNNLILSPMAGFSDLPFRILCRRHGAGLVCTEMVSAGGIEHEGVHATRRRETSAEERPTSIQIFGTDPELAAQAARVCEPDCEILGFNMGCPAHQIRRAGCGAALLDDPERCVEIVAAIKSASNRPLLVKFRAGNETRIDVVAFARRLEDAGADGLIFHARTASQNYSGRADWSLIREVKAAVTIPLVGNGDIVDGPSAADALRTSGADGIAIGRAALGDPRIFSRIATYLRAGTIVPAAGPEEKAADYLAYLDMAIRMGFDTPRLLQQAHRFTRGLRGGSDIRVRLRGAGIPAESIRREFERIASGPSASVVGGIVGG